MAKTIRILILEDDLETLARLFKGLAQLEDRYADKGLSISTIVLSEYQDVEGLINKSSMDFDVILLDRDCKIGGSFHILDIDKFGADKIISISSVPQYNEETKLRGVTKIVHKDYSDLDKFADEVIRQIDTMVKGNL